MNNNLEKLRLHPTYGIGDNLMIDESENIAVAESREITGLNLGTGVSFPVCHLPTIDPEEQVINSERVGGLPHDPDRLTILTEAVNNFRDEFSTGLDRAQAEQTRLWAASHRLMDHFGQYDRRTT